MWSRLLVVEDEEIQEKSFLSCYRKEIKAGKYELIFARTGEEALEIIEKDKGREIDLIISDLKMPAAQINGWELIKILHDKHIDIKIIVVTAWGHPEDFSEEERENIIFFLDRSDASLETIKNLVEFSLERADRFDIKSQKVRFNTLLKALKDLPSKQKSELIKRSLEFIEWKDLKKLETELPLEIQRLLEEALKRDELKQWLLEKQEKKEISSDIPLREVEYFRIDVNPRGPYYNLRWWQEGRLWAKYIPKDVGDSIPPHLLKKYKNV